MSRLDDCKDVVQKCFDQVCISLHVSLLIGFLHYNIKVSYYHYIQTYQIHGCKTVIQEHKCFHRYQVCISLLIQLGFLHYNNREALFMMFFFCINFSIQIYHCIMYSITYTRGRKYYSSFVCNSGSSCMFVLPITVMRWCE